MKGPDDPQRGLLRDLAGPGWIKVKGALFLLLGLLAAGLLMVEHPSLIDAVLLLVCVWGFCRAYYFVFYVIEHYVDPGYKFSELALDELGAEERRHRHRRKARGKERPCHAERQGREQVFADAVQEGDRKEDERCRWRGGEHEQGHFRPRLSVPACTNAPGTAGSANAWHRRGT